MTESTALTRLAHKPCMPELIKRRVKILVADIFFPVEELLALLKGVDVFISAILGTALPEQMDVVTVVKEGVRRFVPFFIVFFILATVCPVRAVVASKD